MNNISIFSYNIFWKVMKNNDLKFNINKSNIIANITNIKNYYNPFIYCFQEAESSEDIINLFDSKYYKWNLGYSNPEHILTIWRKDIMKKKIIFNGEFESGRPFSIIIFKDIRFNIYWMLINIHAGHHHDTNSSIFVPIQKIITSNINKIGKYDIKRIVIIGDFNRNISSQIFIEPKKFFLTINSNVFYFKSIHNENKTCCSISGWGYTNNYDQIIDSYSNPLLTYQLNKESWYYTKSSDHLAILSIIKNIEK